MPLEIKELNIKVTVAEPKESNAGTRVNSLEHSSAMPTAELIDICVERVLAVLKNKRER